MIGKGTESVLKSMSELNMTLSEEIKSKMISNNKFNIVVNKIKSENGLVTLEVAASFEEGFKFSMVNDNYNIFISKTTSYKKFENNLCKFIIGISKRTIKVKEEDLNRFFKQLRRFCNLLTFHYNNGDDENFKVYSTFDYYGTCKYITIYRMDNGSPSISRMDANGIRINRKIAIIYFNDNDEVITKPIY